MSKCLADIIKRKDRVSIGIIGAMDQEVELLKSAIDGCEEQRFAGYSFYTGKLHGQPVVLLQSGIGKVNAAISTALLLQVFAPDCVINTGSAGGFDPALDVGDVVISTEVRHHDVDVTVFGYEPGQVPGLPAAFEPDPLLAQIAERCIGKRQGVKTVRGLIATGDSFMNCPERVARTRVLFPAMKAVEMEAAAIAQTCHRFDTPFIIIRALSDIAGKESNLSFEQFLETAARHSAEMVMDIVDAIARQPSG
ncbi:5'-methylthioadenosine/S-adenosylhomocysteine nucleosidase [Marinobacterium nitratireducens]|uniref:5'-methylthioadenosine/S-adenosylhomocysteine nucleosidase n=1 Tax=Marinobacterium nitratireducens TaxID=518897 RepID=A0A918DQC1_9GAMM|nr:5'-methylthioadenosine/S-adenosylhomocysteine nucleosidase [Marinobacterium nitratireducens]GGO77093.1 5'-methylthioadenosine/S-adenosylhomocysteine nucleosidase [Marinobacterium nitratireducens]